MNIIQLQKAYLYKNNWIVSFLFILLYTKEFWLFLDFRR
jgi:hypothetical protein